jgi:hypothetical protein
VAGPFATPVTSPVVVTVAMFGESDSHPDVIGWVSPLERLAVPVAWAVAPILIGLETVTAIEDVVGVGGVGAAGDPPPPHAENTMKDPPNQSPRSIA